MRGVLIHENKAAIGFEEDVETFDNTDETQGNEKQRSRCGAMLRHSVGCRWMRADISPRSFRGAGEWFLRRLRVRW